MRIYQVDAFTNTPFAGNPAAVCILGAPRDDAWMQRLAAEMNLSETAFLVPRADGFGLRWFTPEVEVELCGHATLASAHILWEQGLLAADETARFHTLSGLLTARRVDDLIELDFPAVTVAAVTPPPALLEALDVAPVFVGKNRMDYLVEVADEATVRALAPDFRRLKGVEARGVMVTSRSTSPDYDFVSRFFGPAAGIDEDPVTGSAHCCLGPYWAAKLGKTDLRAYQASARGGKLRVIPQGDRVLLRGQAVTVLVGTLIGEPTIEAGNPILIAEAR
jgi:PhzF family phenazine biosynthesis protein